MAKLDTTDSVILRLLKLKEMGYAVTEYRWERITNGGLPKVKLNMEMVKING